MHFACLFTQQFQPKTKKKSILPVYLHNVLIWVLPVSWHVFSQKWDTFGVLLGHLHNASRQKWEKNNNFAKIFIYTFSAKKGKFIMFVHTTFLIKNLKVYAFCLFVNTTTFSAKKSESLCILSVCLHNISRQQK